MRTIFSDTFSPLANTDHPTGSNPLRWRSISLIKSSKWECRICFFYSTVVLPQLCTVWTLFMTFYFMAVDSDFSGVESPVGNYSLFSESVFAGVVSITWRVDPFADHKKSSSAAAFTSFFISLLDMISPIYLSKVLRVCHRSHRWC